MGFQTQEIQISIADGERVEQVIALQPDFIEGDEVLVMGRQRGKARALTSQRESINIRNVVSSKQMDRFGDATVSGALQRVAGMVHGGTKIRGVGAGMTNLTMDGLCMGSTGTGGRSVDVRTISADVVQELEVIKVITPDMNADALAGVINISTRLPEGGERNMNVRVGGGWRSRFAEVIGPSYRTSFSYGDSPRNDISYAVNLSYQRSTDAEESIRTDWATRSFVGLEGPRDVLNRLQTRLQMSPSERYGVGLQFTFQPTEWSTYHVQGMFNYQNMERVNYYRDFSPKVGQYTGWRYSSFANGEEAMG